MSILFCLDHAWRTPVEGRRLDWPGWTWRMLLVRYHVGVHERAGTDWMHFGRGEGHLYQFDYEGKDR